MLPAVFLCSEKSDPDYYRHYFTYSILQTPPGNLNEKDAIRIKTLYKEKLGTCAFVSTRTDPLRPFLLSYNSINII